MARVLLLGGVVGFAVNLLVGGLALYVGARYVVYRDRYGHGDVGHAVVTALAGAVVWAVLAGVPLVGPVLALAGWLAIVRWRYPGGWVKAVSLAAVAWAAAVIMLALLDLLGLGGVTALGVPGA